ncbi:hypothetical protein K504DRAFT_448009 [Pleomassaria siparia CBS 279.74]|uniref:Uncharacterized protein n=1 Tax=Pleomassaria siparia CBS 279.74 TaxID=1314801 RepID=A0A6G1K1A3_9PLEO|nr:hypothetical protein K504DRAFT_448009 [Pleomassaria siparia CBS 279.74]
MAPRTTRQSKPAPKATNTNTEPQPEAISVAQRPGDRPVRTMRPTLKKKEAEQGQLPEKVAPVRQAEGEAKKSSAKEDLYSEENYEPSHYADEAESLAFPARNGTIGVLSPWSEAAYRIADNQMMAVEREHKWAYQSHQEKQVGKEMRAARKKKRQDKRDALKLELNKKKSGRGG